jgi:hypothetical protein
MFKKWYERFKGWFQSPVTEEPVDQFKPKEDNYVFVYWDGDKEVTIDPIVYYRKVLLSKVALFTPKTIMELLAEEENGFENYNKMVAKIREIFAIKPKEEGGLSEYKCLEVFHQFIGFCNGVMGLPVAPIDRSKPQQPEGQKEVAKEEAPGVQKTPEPPSA